MDTLQDKFMDFWDSNKDTLNLGEYSDAVLYFWLGILKEREDEMLKRLEKSFEMKIDEYLPLVKLWKGGFDIPFDHGYAQGKKDAQTIIKDVMQG